MHSLLHPDIRMKTQQALGPGHLGLPDSRSCVSYTELSHLSAGEKQGLRLVDFMSILSFLCEHHRLGETLQGQPHPLHLLCSLRSFFCPRRTDHYWARSCIFIHVHVYLSTKTHAPDCQGLFFVHCLTPRI